MECWAWAAECHAQQSSIQAKFGEPLIILALSLSRVNAELLTIPLLLACCLLVNRHCTPRVMMIA
jgi:hypothetical protein